MTRRYDAGSIVVGVDGSPQADRAVAWAAEQAWSERCKLVAVTVGEGDASFASDAVAAAQRLHADLLAEPLRVSGDPRRVLLDLATDARLVVLGSRGRGAMKTMLLGSVSAAVAAHATCPVVVCRPDDQQPGHRGVLVGADGSAESVPVVEFAYRMAALRGCALTVLHCFWDVMAAAAQYRETRGDVVAGPELEDLRAVMAESVAGLAATYPDVPVAFDFKHGLVDEALTSRGDEWDLVVVGRHPTDSLVRTLTGSIARTVLEHSRTTVAVVPEARPAG